MVSCLWQENEGAARTLPSSLGAREPLKLGSCWREEF